MCPLFCFLLIIFQSGFFFFLLGKRSIEKLNLQNWATWVSIYDTKMLHLDVLFLIHPFLQASQKGNVGITLTTRWYIPLSSSKSDLAAVQRTLDFSYGWYVITQTHMSQYTV